MTNDTHTIPLDYLNGVDTAIVAGIAQQAVLPRKLVDGELYAVLNGDKTDLVETPGYTDQHEDGRAQAPRSVMRSVTTEDAASFLAYLEANTTLPPATEGKDTPQVGIQHRYDHPGQLEVWASLPSQNIVAHLDGGEGWHHHRATLALRLSREWAEWQAIDGQLLDQVKFAEFIEDHLSTIGDPDGATLLEVCQSLQAKTNVNFKSQQFLANGQRQIQFEETIEAKAGQKGGLKIPAELTLVLRPFQGCEPVAIQARFRFRISEGTLRLGVRMAEPEKALEDAFDGVVGEVGAGVPVPVLYGRG
ncbi:MAG: YfdQ family protein [Propionibacteriales bacterium]|nr:YfdQ family protein [Propionibacteriales bacterium]